LLWKILLSLVLGLIVFLAGLLTLRNGLTRLASKQTEKWIQQFVKTPFRGVVIGIIATLFTQSSAAVTIISMGLVSAGVLEFSDTIAIILGTNVGSTFTVGLLSLNVERIGPYVLALGLLLLVHKRTRAVAISIAGFGVLFIGFHLMTNAVVPITKSPLIINWLVQAKNQPWLGLLAGTVVTALIGSSSASTALTLGLTQSGALPLLGAVAVVFGNNIGTCMTAILASLGGSRAVKRVAATHVLLNVVGALLFMVFIAPFTDLILHLSADPGRQVFLAHLLFNVISSWIAYPFVKQIAKSIEHLLPDLI
jgi:phosphate:Na+ symporter